ncbi:hypothetical protein ACJJTC_010147 [Scirpophaga incertulas]
MPCSHAHNSMLMERADVMFIGFRQRPREILVPKFLNQVITASREDRFVWRPGIDGDIERTCASCAACVAASTVLQRPVDTVTCRFLGAVSRLILSFLRSAYFLTMIAKISAGAARSVRHERAGLGGLSPKCDLHKT